MKNNEYNVTFIRSNSTKFLVIPHIIEKGQDKNRAVTPLIHSLFGAFEMLGITKIVVDKETNQMDLAFSDTLHGKKLRKSVGKLYLMAIATELFKVLQGLGISEFSRNLDNQTTKETFKITDNKLNIILEKSILMEDGNR